MAKKKQSALDAIKASQEAKGIIEGIEKPIDKFTRDTALQESWFLVTPSISWDPLWSLQKFPEDIPETTVATEADPIVDKDKSPLQKKIEADAAANEKRIADKRKKCNDRGWIFDPVTETCSFWPSWEQKTVDPISDSLKKKQAEADIDLAKQTTQEQLQQSAAIAQQELAREVARIEAAWKRTMDTTARSLALAWGLRGTAWAAKMQDVTNSVNELISTANAKADLEQQLRDAKIKGVWDEELKRLNERVASINEDLAEQEEANLQAQLSVAAEIWADALESVLWILDATWTDTSWVDQDLSKEAWFLINSDWTLVLNKNWDAIALSKNAEELDAKITNFKDWNDNTFVYKNWALDTVITTDWRVLKWNQLKNLTVPKEVENSKAQKELIDRQTNLRKEFNALPQTKRIDVIQSAAQKVEGSAKAESPAWDLAMIFNFMKMLDPWSVVRESEFATAANAAPLLEKLWISFDKISAVWDGNVLTPTQRRDFLERAKDVLKWEDELFQETKDFYSDIAEKLWVDKDTIFPSKLEIPEVTINPEDDSQSIFDQLFWTWEVEWISWEPTWVEAQDDESIFNIISQ